jgi:hypothetical protein
MLLAALPSALEAQMRSDWDAWFANTPTGTVVDWGAGQWMRGEGDAAFYRSSSGTVTRLDRGNPDFEGIARAVPEIAAEWSRYYGYDILGGRPTGAAPGGMLGQNAMLLAGAGVLLLLLMRRKR